MTLRRDVWQYGGPKGSKPVQGIFTNLQATHASGKQYLEHFRAASFLDLQDAWCLGSWAHWGPPAAERNESPFRNVSPSLWLVFLNTVALLCALVSVFHSPWGGICFWGYDAKTLLGWLWCLVLFRQHLEACLYVGTSFIVGASLVLWRFDALQP